MSPDASGAVSTYAAPAGAQVAIKCVALRHRVPAFHQHLRHVRPTDAAPAGCRADLLDRQLHPYRPQSPDDLLDPLLPRFAEPTHHPVHRRVLRIETIPEQVHRPRPRKRRRHFDAGQEIHPRTHRRRFRFDQPRRGVVVGESNGRNPRLRRYRNHLRRRQ